MLTNIVEIIAKIYERINNNYSLDDAVKEVNKTKKYDKKIIAAAYSWVYEKIIRDFIDEDEKEIHSLYSFRVFSDEEIEMLGKDNYNYIMHFYYINLLTNDDVEFIVEQLLLLPQDAMNFDTINILILSLFIDTENISPGSRLMLYSSDTIN